MPVYRPPAGMTRHLLADHLAQLTASLERLDERLREGLASAVGQTIAGAIREALLLLLSEKGVVPSFHGDPHRLSAPWQNAAQTASADGLEPERLPWEEQEDPRWSQEDDPWNPQVAQELPAPAKPRRWFSALAAGWQATSWWLRKPPRRFHLLTALGVGLAVGMAALMAGPLAGAGLGVLGTSMSLLTMSATTARLTDLAVQ